MARFADSHARGQETYRCLLCDRWHWGGRSRWPDFPPEIIAQYRPRIRELRAARHAQQRRKKQNRATAASGAELEWEAAFSAESMAADRTRGPYLPHDLVTALDDAPLATVKAFLTELKAHAGQDIPAAQLWAWWHRKATG
jgi:hypothetical protein